MKVMTDMNINYGEWR